MITRAVAAPMPASTPPTRRGQRGDIAWATTHSAAPPTPKPAPASAAQPESAPAAGRPATGSAAPGPPERPPSSPADLDAHVRHGLDQLGIVRREQDRGTRRLLPDQPVGQPGPPAGVQPLLRLVEHHQPARAY